ncbi:lantibiotic immunity ABC transporter MutE/EpiE family permease subunit [Thermoanaerobacterium butyriciformans]|uniref:ABC-2 type transport system permease protein n=1 Tax=Thermoanaerobacterium butyriciformans TaxID=1702242 RepID=A0ABS4NFH3_9THEO|nr:lantibiotic immunity ABC transporter MutE/EpiE family permease subunit [Thermoanaerobacterium butyriciformans]MBP2072426.1 ABC-2 type transport system permease protein [Thermoanaerobacterium butyriciformans]
MISILKSENLKYRRTFMRKLIIFAPLFFVLYALPQKIFMPANYLMPWQLLIDLVYNWWPVIFIPIGLALYASLVALHEKKSGGYRSIKNRNVPLHKIWIGKILIMAFYTFLSTLVLIIAIIMTGTITAGGDIPWVKIIAGGFFTWVTSLALIPLELWLATMKGTFYSIALGFVGLIIGVIGASKSYWIYIPWSWPIRLMCPIIGVHPNGTLLQINDSLRDPSVIPIGVIVSVLAFLIFSILTMIWFQRRDLN